MSKKAKFYLHLSHSKHLLQFIASFLQFMHRAVDKRVTINKIYTGILLTEID